MQIKLYAQIILVLIQCFNAKFQTNVRMEYFAKIKPVNHLKHCVLNKSHAHQEILYVKIEIANYHV